MTQVRAIQEMRERQRMEELRARRARRHAAHEKGVRWTGTLVACLGSLAFAYSIGAARAQAAASEACERAVDAPCPVQRAALPAPDVAPAAAVARAMAIAEAGAALPPAAEPEPDRGDGPVASVEAELEGPLPATGAALAELQRTTRRAARPAPRRVRMTSTPSGAEIRVSGHSTGLVTPAYLEVPPAADVMIEVELVAPGHRATRAIFSLADGFTRRSGGWVREVDVALDPL